MITCKKTFLFYPPREVFFSLMGVEVNNRSFWGSLRTDAKSVLVAVAVLGVAILESLCLTAYLMWVKSVVVKIRTEVQDIQRVARHPICICILCYFCSLFLFVYLELPCVVSQATVFIVNLWVPMISILISHGNCWVRTLKRRKNELIFNGKKREFPCRNSRQSSNDIHKLYGTTYFNVH